MSSPEVAPEVTVGLGFQSDKTLVDYARLATAAEELGFDVLSVYGDLYYQPPIVALVTMARATTRVRLGPACLNPFVLHPVEIAAQIAVLDAASEGRAYLGLARGSWLEELGVDQRDVPAAMAEAVTVIDALLCGRDSGVAGTRFRLPPGAQLRGLRVPGPVPLLIGAWGPRLAALGGEIAAEVKLGGSSNPSMVRLLRSRVATGEAAAGRTPGSCSVVVGAVTVVADDRAAARRRARENVAMYLDVVAALDPTVDVGEELLSELHRCIAAGDHARAASLVPDELLSRFAFSGTPEDVAEQAATVVEAGASRVEFGTPHGLSDDEGVQLLGRRVLPALRSLLA
ncbi:MAG: LLM class flavin-dependent oxidoreductase [Actinomycetota bacterium]|nr:LLM class flavin-dependent oxidoreductase [Actinomycetota bacterium]